MLRPALALALLLSAAPLASASAASVHLAYGADGGYVVTFSSPTPLPDPKVTWSGGSAAAQAWPHPAADNDSIYVAKLPANVGDYTIEGRTFHARPPPAPGATTRVAFVADWGHSEDSWSVYDAIVAAKPDLLIVGGDLSY